MWKAPFQMFDIVPNKALVNVLLKSDFGNPFTCFKVLKYASIRVFSENLGIFRSAEKRM